MIRNDLSDGLLVFLTGVEGKSSLLILDQEEYLDFKYVVYVQQPSGEIEDVYRFTSLKDAVMEFALMLPRDEL